MVLRILCMIIMVCMLPVPVSATSVDDEGTTDGTTADSTAAASAQEASETTVPSQEDDSLSSLAIADGEFAGGYYFVCDCTFGNDIKFYVPIEWAEGAFTIDSSGALVNLSTSTCYAYCPNYPNYTFTCSRFGTFVYRMSGSTTYDLEVSEVTDTNMSLLKDSYIYLSDKEITILIATLIFAVCALLIIRRG